MNFTSLTSALTEFSTLKWAFGKPKGSVKSLWVTCPSYPDEWGKINQWGIRWSHRYCAAYSAVLESVISDHHIVALCLHDGKALTRVNDTLEIIVGYLNPDILVRGDGVHDSKALSAYRLVYESVSFKDHGSL